MPKKKPPTEQEAQQAAEVLKDFCNSQYSCIKCPLTRICKTEPYLWELNQHDK